MLDFLFELLGDLFLGALPERQPWRAVVGALYTVGIVAGAALLVVLLVRAV